jgi:sugar O-acyltransferase (sialic acid O-acetyltransferase NeuD family)
MPIAKQRLIIISAGSFGREVCAMAWAIQTTLGPSCPWQVTGFLDDRSSILDSKDPTGAPILASPEDYQPDSLDRFICAVGDPQQRQHYAELITQKGGQFLPLTWPGSLLAGHGARRGPGSVVGPFCLISSDVTLGAHTMIVAHATIGHDVTIGTCSHIGAYAFVGGGAVIGDCVTIHPHACILPGAVIEDDATVGAGSVVLKRVPRGQTVFGVPALPVKA